MYASFGPGWSNSLLGFLGLVLIPAPLAIYRFGSGEVSFDAVMVDRITEVGIYVLDFGI